MTQTVVLLQSLQAKLLSVFWRDCVYMGSWEDNCYEASEVSTLARCLNQSYFPAVLPSDQVAIYFGTAETRRLNWDLLEPPYLRIRSMTDCTLLFTHYFTEKYINNEDLDDLDV